MKFFVRTRVLNKLSAIIVVASVLFSVTSTAQTRLYCRDLFTKSEKASLGRPVIVRRGIQGDWRKYDPTYGSRSPGYNVWISRDHDAFKFAKGLTEQNEKYFVIEYQIPSDLLFTQYGAFGQPKPQPPRRGEWGFFRRSDIGDERAYITKIYFPRSVEIEPGYPVYPDGWFEFQYGDVFSATGIYLGPRGRAPRNINGEVNLN